MAKQKTTKKQNIVEQTIINQNDVNSTTEDIQIQQSIVEQNNTPEEIIVNETIKEEVKAPIQEKNTSNDNKVSKIIQRRPSHYSLLMQDGRQVVVHKSLFDRATMTIKSH